MNTNDHPIPDSYWVEPGRFLAGEYPGSLDDSEAAEKIGRLLDAGVTFFIDLTEVGEYGLKPYDHIAQEVAARGQRMVSHRRLPIRDMSAPSPESMRFILENLRQALSQGEVIYLHCFGGIGRTGTVAGCYLVEQGMSGEEALAEIARRRADTPDGWRRSPETEAQRDLVRMWGSYGAPTSQMAV